MSDSLNKFFEEDRKGYRRGNTIAVRFVNHPDLAEFVMNRVGELGCSKEAYVRALIRRDMREMSGGLTLPEGKMK